MPQSANSSNTPPPMRQSCDRCHRQKLRCTRTSNAGVCNRCLRKRVECVYSTCLPKGRPSLYKATDEAAAEPETGLITPESLIGAERSLSFLASGGEVNADAAAADGSLAPGVVSGVAVDIAMMEPSCDGIGIFVANMDVTHNDITDVDINQGAPLNLMNVSTDMCTTETWPNLQAFMGFDGPLDWGDGLSNPEWQTVFDSQVDHDTPLSDDFPSKKYTRDMDGGDAGLISPDHIVTGNAQTLCADPAVESHTNADGTYQYDHSIENIMMQLFQLSMRLGELRRSSYALVKNMEPSVPSSSSTSSPPSKNKSTSTYQPRLLDDAAFKSVAAWLHEAGSSPKPKEEKNHSPESTEARGGLLHDVLSASHHLLEILMHGISTLPTAATPTPTLSAFSSSSSLSTQMSSVSDGGSSIYTISSSQRSNNTIIRHLVIACHTMLLTIHVVILAVLQHDSDQPTLPMGTAALGQIRLVSVVQLCAYVIERQHQAVDSYLSVMQQAPLRNGNLSWSLTGNANQGTESQQPLPSPIQVPEDEAIHELTNEVQQRLLRLQQTLGIC